MKKFLLCLSLLCVVIMSSACTQQIVFIDRDLNTTKTEFDKYIKSTGYEYKLKDDVNNIYNVHLYQYNLQYLLQSKPMISQDYGFTCKFKSLGKDTLMSCTGYPSSIANLPEVKKHLKEQKFDNVEYMKWKKYKKINNL